MNKKLRIGLMGLAAKPIPMTEGYVCAPHNIVYNLAVELRKAGYEVVLFTGKDSKNDLSVYSANLSSVWHEFGGDSANPVQYTAKRIEYDLILSYEAIKLYKARKIDLVNSHDFRTSPYLFSALNVPVLYTVHGDLKNHTDEYDKYRYNLISHSMIGMTNISHDNEKFCEKMRIKNFGYTPNGIDINKFSYSDKPRDGVLIVARVVQDKLVEESIEGALKTSEKITLIGPRGTSQEDLEYFDNLNKKYFLTGKVEYLGPKKQNDLIEYYQKSSVLLYLSKGEGMPLTILESMSCGTPAIASNVGGIADIIQDGESGFLVEEPKPDLIAEKVLLAKNINNRKCRDQIEERFSYTAMMLNYQKAYHKFFEDLEKK